jgi:hypothetical protein
MHQTHQAKIESEKYIAMLQNRLGKLNFDKLKAEKRI